jgi:DnaJ-class molecular chaperone
MGAMMNLIAFLLCLPLQEDPHKILVDPARRAQEADRKAALQTFRNRAGAVPHVAAQFLEKSDAQWSLPAPAAADLNAFLARFWATPPSTEPQHQEALAAILAAVEKHGRAGGAPEIFRLFALAHLSALGDKAADAAAKLGFVKEGDRWGRKDQLALYAITQGFSKPAYIPAEAEKMASSSPSFGPRYVAMLLDIQKAISANSGFDVVYKALSAATAPQTPPSVANHLKALADGLKNSAACANCKEGKITCDICQGKKRTDITCHLCKGIGWAQKGEQANVLIKCVNCRGTRVFKNSACPNCKQTGAVECIISGGKGWRDNFKGCKSCKICDTCKGRRQVETPCATCGGKGRVPPIVMGDVPSILCSACKGNASSKEPCKSCSETGLADCAVCGGKGARDGKSPARPKVADVYVTEPCAACAGKGWPLPNLAIPCERCFGLGLRVKPTADATKVLE